MFPATVKEIEVLIEEGRAANKDVSDLEEYVEGVKENNDKVLCGNRPQCHKKAIGRRTIISTGPAREEDFE